MGRKSSAGCCWAWPASSWSLRPCGYRSAPMAAGFATKAGGLQFAEVEGTVWASRLILFVLVVVAAGLVGLVMFLIMIAARSTGVIDTAIAPVTGVLAALISMVAARMSFLTPLSVAAGSVDIRG